MNQNEAVFRDAPVRTAVVRMAVPTVISSLVLVIYNMADTFFVGQTHDAMQVAAVSLTNPVFVMFMAIANLLGIGGSIYYVWYFMRRSSMLSIHPRHLRGDKHQMVQVVTIGIPAGVNSALMSIATVLLNNALVQYGDDSVAAMGIVTKAYLFIVFIHMGITNGIQPLLGYCFGAGLRRRFLDILKFSGILTVVCGTTLSAVYIIFSRQIVALFIDDASVITYGGPMLIATSIAGPILGLLFLSINSMQALGRPLPATMLSVCRQGLIFIPLLYILDAGFGLNGINFTQAVADYISIVLAIILLVQTLKAFKGKPESENSLHISQTASNL